MNPSFVINAVSICSAGDKRKICMGTKMFLVAVLMVCMCFTANAAVVSVSTAQTVALNFYKITTGNNSHSLTAALSFTKAETDGTIDFYVFNITPVNGFVMVAAASNVPPILGYSTESAFNSNYSHTGMNDWVNTISGKIHQAVVQNIAPVTSTTELWSLYRQGQAPGVLKATVVSPLVTCTWNQENDITGPPPYIYNLYCPFNSHDNQRCVTGCVATAMAQIMYYWKYPTTGNGSYSYVCTNSFTGDTSNYGTLSANFGATTYPWATMPTVLTNSTTATQDSAVDLISYQAGISVAMGYGDDVQGGSASYVFNYSNPSAANAFKWYFRYDSVSLQYLYRSSYDSAAWMNLINNELVAGRPFIYTGNDPSDGGHAWVCDGYDAQNLLHMNWGWGGVDNGYYAISYLYTTPDFNGNYSTTEAILIGIQKQAVPVAAMGISSTISCSGIYQFADASTGGPTSWLWNFGDGYTSTLQNPTHMYTANGSYTVSLQATNGFGTNTVTNTNYVTVSKAAAPAANNVSQCAAGSVSLSVNTTDQVIWYDSAGAVISGSNPYTTPVLTKPESYWYEDWLYDAAITTTYTVGPADPAGGLSYFSTANTNYFNLQFSTLAAITVNTVDIYAIAAGSETIVW